MVERLKISRTPEVRASPDANLPIAARPAPQTPGATFQINSTKLYVPVVTLSTKNNINI